MRINGTHFYSPALLVFLSLVVLILVFPAISGSGDQQRAAIDEKYKWNLNDLYPTVDDWKKEKEKITAQFSKMSEFKGNLGQSAEQLKKALDTYYQIQKDFIKVYVYASMLSDQDTQESNPLAMKQEVGQLYTEFSKKTSYMDPEILAIPQEIMDKFFKDEPGLQTYRHVIDNVQRMRAHTLSAEQESIIAEAGRMASTPSEIYTILSNADLPYPTIKLSDGKEVRLNKAGYALYRAVANREDRIKVFDSFFGALANYSRTFGTELFGEIKKNMFNKNVRNYQSCLESALDHDNIPTQVYHKLIENTNKNLDTFQRYLKLRKRMLGVDELHYYDMYPSVVKDVDLSYTYEEAVKNIEEALSVLGKEYVATVDKAVKDRWIDVMPNTGKQSGAYSQGSAYDVHPYILLNFNGKYEDMTTLAHELGHTMHSYFSNKNQPYHNSDYPTFLAEVASTANEAILMDHMLKKIDSNEERLALLGNYLDNFKGTLFRQTQFAEFELKIHELVEKGESLTGEKFTEIYKEILKKYYGHEKGVCIIDDQYAIEWAYIPHFYYNFYVFQYSTSFMAAQALAAKMLRGDSKMVEKYLAFLSSGASDYAIPTLKKVGIDMTSDEPFTLAMKKMNDVMDEMEKILDEM